MASAAVTEQSFFLSAPVWFFCLGVLLWAGLFASGLRGRFLYVLGHELTHAVFAKLFGGTVVDIKVSRSGGMVLTDKNNLLISLSPYFIPFWTLVTTALYGLGWLVTDLSHTYQGFFFGLADFRWDRLLFIAVGVTWAMHLTYTVWMLSKDQPDLWHYGPFLSLVVIYLVNLCLIAALLIMASPQLEVTELWTSVVEQLSRYRRGSWI
jgi:hypothetical protein